MRGYAGGLHVTVTSVGGIASELVHYTSSLLITVVLLVLTLRAARLPGTPVANILFAVCGILWSAGGLLRVLLVASGSPDAMAWVTDAQALQYSGAAAFPIAILAVWWPFTARPAQKTASRALLLYAIASAGTIVVLFWLQSVFRPRWCEPRHTTREWCSGWVRWSCCVGSRLRARCIFLPS